MFDRAANMDDTISMGIGEPDMDTSKDICKFAYENLCLGNTHYTANAGNINCRKIISKYSTINSLDYSPEKEIIITPGGMGALSLLLSVLINHGDEVLISNPQWLNYESQITFFGGVPVPVPTLASQEFILTAEAIEQKITPHTKLLMINTPNNPTGKIIPRDELEKIAVIVKKHNILVVSDEVYNTLYYFEKPVSISELPGMKKYTVVINSLSKAYAMTGWRLGYAAGPADIIEAMTKAQENMTACVNTAAQAAAQYAYQHPEIADEIRLKFAQRRKTILHILDEIEGISYIKPDGAFYVFANISSFGMDSKQFCLELLDKEHVVCVPGSAFGSCGEGFIRIAYTCDEDKIREGMIRLKNFCDCLRREKR